MRKFTSEDGKIEVSNKNVLDLYDEWETPTVIISDGPYGVKGFPGDPPTPLELAEIYEEHVKKWTEKSTTKTTLWFWNTEIGWATVHPILQKYGWTYKACNVWNKGIAHIAGNCNVKTLSKFPVVTEVCVQYVKNTVNTKEYGDVTTKDWLRIEWERTGMAFSKTNEACEVKSAATRKYFTKDHLWYSPPADAFEKLVNYANLNGEESGKPYFSVDGVNSLNKEEWKNMQPIFNCPYKWTNVWDIPAVHGKERLKDGSKYIHLNQKPLRLMDLLISSSSNEGDVIWEPFGGLFSATISSYNLNRKAFSTEIDENVFEKGKQRIEKIIQKKDE